MIYLQVLRFDIEVLGDEEFELGGVKVGDGANHPAHGELRYLPCEVGEHVNGLGTTSCIASVEYSITLPLEARSISTGRSSSTATTCRVLARGAATWREGGDR